jgi:hypothetical protein
MYTKVKSVTTSEKAFTLNELMIAIGIYSLGVLVLASISVFCLRSFSALANYSVLDGQNRQVMDKITQEIRQARWVSNYSTNPPTLAILNGASQTVVYSFDAAHQMLTRSVNGSQQVLLKNCSLINFNLYPRNPTNYSFNLYPLASTNWQSEVKVVELTWKTARAIGGLGRANSENVQTARIVIRK